MLRVRHFLFAAPRAQSWVCQFAQNRHFFQEGWTRASGDAMTKRSQSHLNSVVALRLCSYRCQGAGLTLLLHRDIDFVDIEMSQSSCARRLAEKITAALHNKFLRLGTLNPSRKEIRIWMSFLD